MVGKILNRDQRTSKKENIGKKKNKKSFKNIQRDLRKNIRVINKKNVWTNKKIFKQTDVQTASKENIIENIKKIG